MPAHQQHWQAVPYVAMTSVLLSLIYRDWCRSERVVTDVAECSLTRDPVTPGAVPCRAVPYGVLYRAGPAVKETFSCSALVSINEVALHRAQ